MEPVPNIWILPLDERVTRVVLVLLTICNDSEAAPVCWKADLNKNLESGRLLDITSREAVPVGLYISNLEDMEALEVKVF